MIKRVVFTVFAFSLLLGCGLVPVQAQANDRSKKSLKSLKKALVKDSRYGDEVIYWFKPLEFSSCSVSFRYARINENSSERFATVLVDRPSPMVRTNTVRDGDLTPTRAASTQNPQPTRVTNQTLKQASSRAKVFSNNTFPYFYNGMDQLFYSEQVVTFLDLAAIDLDSIELKTDSRGQEYIVFRSLSDKSAIEKQLSGGGSEAVRVESDFLPLATKKRGAKVIAAFADAVKICSQ